MTEQDLKIQELKELNRSLVEENNRLKKAMERIVERLEELRTCSDFGTCNYCQYRWCRRELLDADEALEIIKEELV